MYYYSLQIKKMGFKTKNKKKLPPAGSARGPHQSQQSRSVQGQSLLGCVVQRVSL
jgi:hypothetical protein